MEKIHRKHWKLNSIGQRKYYEAEYIVATQKEADELGWEYKPWYNAEVDELGVSDDGYVAKCLQRHKYKTKRPGLTQVLMCYPYGRMFATLGAGQRRPHQKLLYEPRRDTGQFGTLSTRPWYEIAKGRTAVKEFVQAYVFQRMNTGEINYDQLGRMVHPKDKLPAVKARSMLKKRYIREMITTEMRRVMDEKGVSEGDVIDMILLAAKISTDKKDAANLNRAAENLVRIFHMTERDTKEATFEGEHVEFGEVDEVLQIDEQMQEEQKLLEESKDEGK